MQNAKQAMKNAKWNDDHFASFIACLFTGRVTGISQV
jgi:hypothetical protein